MFEKKKKSWCSVIISPGKQQNGLDGYSRESHLLGLNPSAESPQRQGFMFRMKKINK